MPTRAYRPGTSGATTPFLGTFNYERDSLLTRLRDGEKGTAWFVLEGESCPDAYLETDSIVVVVEGKRTERTTTSKTTFMPKQSQLIRHMDAAWEVADGRRVLGLLLVEGGSPDPMLVPERWSSASDEQLRPELLVPREALSKALLGAVRDGGSRFQRSWGR